MTEEQATRRIKRIFGEEGRAVRVGPQTYRVGRYRTDVFNFSASGVTWEDAFDALARRLRQDLQYHASTAHRLARAVARHYKVPREERRLAAVAAARFTRTTLPPVIPPPNPSPEDE